MLGFCTLGLDDDGRNLSSVGVHYRTIRQADVDVNRPNVIGVPKVENGLAILHVLLKRHAITKAWRLIPLIYVNPTHKSMRVRKRNKN